MRTAALAIVLLATGCALLFESQHTHTMITEYRPNDFSLIDKSGSARIEGEAFLRTRGGEVKSGAGYTMYLIPQNAYTDEYIAARRQGRKANAVVLGRHSKECVMGSSGDFEFSGLAPGRYYLVSKITWEVPSYSGYYTRMVPAGGTVTEAVEVAAGETKRVIVTGN